MSLLVVLNGEFDTVNEMRRIKNVVLYNFLGVIDVVFSSVDYVMESGVLTQCVPKK